MITSNASRVVQKWVRGYEKGIYTQMETFSALVHAVGSYAPSDLAAEIPPDWLEKVYQLAVKPPDSSSEGWYIGSTLFHGDARGVEERKGEMLQEWFDAIWAWHRYFAEKGR